MHTNQIYFFYIIKFQVIFIFVYIIKFQVIFFLVYIIKFQVIFSFVKIKIVIINLKMYFQIIYVAVMIFVYTMSNKFFLFDLK